MKRIIITTLFTLSLCLGCSSEKSASSNSLVIYCPHPLDFINPLVDDFKAKNPRYKCGCNSRRNGRIA